MIYLRCYLSDLVNSGRFSAGDLATPVSPRPPAGSSCLGKRRPLLPRGGRPRRRPPGPSGAPHRAEPFVCPALPGFSPSATESRESCGLGSDTEPPAPPGPSRLPPPARLPRHGTARRRSSAPSLPFPCKTAPTPDGRKVSRRAPGAGRGCRRGRDSLPAHGWVPPGTHLPAPHGRGCWPR